MLSLLPSSVYTASVYTASADLACNCRCVRAPSAAWSPVYCGKADGGVGLQGRMRKYYSPTKNPWLIGVIDSPDPNTDAYKAKTEQMQDVLTRGCDMKVCPRTQCCADASTGQWAILC